MGWLMAGRDAGRRSLTEIEEPEKDPSVYDIVVVGSPVWNDNVSTPIRTYLEKYHDSFPDLAFFCTGDADDNKAIDEMTKILGKGPKASMKLQRKREIQTGEFIDKVDRFVDQIRSV